MRLGSSDELLRAAAAALDKLISAPNADNDAPQFDIAFKAPVEIS